jgi:hypothetical protein
MEEKKDKSTRKNSVEGMCGTGCGRPAAVHWRHDGAVLCRTCYQARRRELPPPPSPGEGLEIALGERVPLAMRNGKFKCEGCEGAAADVRYDCWDDSAGGMVQREGLMHDGERWFGTDGAGDPGLYRFVCNSPACLSMFDGENMAEAQILYMTTLLRGVRDGYYRRNQVPDHL